MKILHTSDWHLGATEQNYSLKEDQLFFLEQIYKVVEDEKIDVVVIAGDVFDRSVASAEAVNLYDGAMRKLCVDMGVKVICIAGNHDSADRLSNCGALLEKAGLYVQGALEKEPKIVSINDTDFYLLPWFTEEKVKTLFPEEKDNICDITEAYQIVCDKCRKTFVEGRKHIAVSHAFIANSKTSVSDRAAVIGFASQVDASVFEGFDYVALGHIHKPQDVGKNIRYCGTPMPYSFGAEENQEKSVTIIDTDDMSIRIVALGLLHKRTTIRGTFDEVLNFECSEDVKNGYVRVDVSDQYLGLDAVSRLNLVYPNLITWSGRVFESENAGITMTIEEFNELESNPEAVFKSFYRETVDKECDPDEHMLDLFRKCITEVEE